VKGGLRGRKKPHLGETGRNIVALLTEETVAGTVKEEEGEEKF